MRGAVKGTAVQRRIATIGAWLTLPAAGMPAWATTSPGGSPGLEFVLSLGALVFLILFFGLLVWNRNQQRSAQRRTQDLLAQLTESNAHTRDLKLQLDEHKQTEEMLVRRGHLKRLIASLSSDFVRLNSADIDEGINRALALIGDFSHMARAYVFLVREDGDTVDNTHEWCSPGVAPFRDRLQGVSLKDDVPWFGARIRAFREVHIPSVDELPPEARMEKSLFRLQEIGSIFCVPMISGNRLRGFLGFDSLVPHDTWPDDLVQLLRIVCEIFTNALDRRRTEKTLRESEERFRELADLLPQTIFETDGAMRLTYTNRQGMLDTGYDAEDLATGLSAFELFQADDAGLLRERLIALQQTGEGVGSQEFTCRRKDGTTFPAMIYSRPVVRDGATQGFRGILIDMTRHKEEEEARRRLEAQFLQTQKVESLSVMAGSIAHNFNNLLTVARGNLEMVLSDTPVDALWRENLLEAERALKRATDLSSMLLTYVGKSRMNLEEVDLNALLTDMVPMLRASLSKDVQLHFTPCDDACLFRGDPGHVRQVVVNLVNNAAEALGETSGSISLSVGHVHHAGSAPTDPVHERLPAGDYVYLELRDSGHGMDAATRARVFDPFFTTRFTGRGLGLAAVQGIVRAHHGSIRLDSRPDQGTLARVMFPRVLREDEIVAVTLPKPEPFTGSGTVLLVDDEVMVLGVGRRMLQRLGFDVLTAESGAQAAALFESHHPKIRCVLLDLTMPQMDGEETFRALYAIDPEVRVVMASGYSEEEIKARFAPPRPTTFIRKPFQIKELGVKLQEALRTDGA